MKKVVESTSYEKKSVETMTARPSWAGVTSIAAGTFILVTTEFLPISLLSPIANSFKISDGIAGLSVTAPGFVAAIAAPALAVMAGRIDRRTVIVALTIAIIASNIITALAPNFTIFLIGRLLLGMAVGGLWTFAVPVGRQLVPEASGARATSIISAGICAGTVSGMPVGAVVGDMAGWRMVFAANAVLGLIILLIQARALPRLPTFAAVDLKRLTALTKIPVARIVLFASSFVAGGHFIAYTFLEPYLRDTLAFGQTGIALALTGYAVTGIAGSFLGEKLAAGNIGRAFVAASSAVGISVLIAVAAGGETTTAITMVMIWGLSFGAVPVCIQIWMFTSSPELYEAGSALLVSAFQIALAAGAAIGGLLVDSHGIPTAFYVSGGVVLIGAMFALRALSLRRVE